MGRLQKFPGVLQMSSKSKRHRTKSKGKSPQNMKAHHNLYVAYIKGNARRIKPATKHSHYHPVNKTALTKHQFDHSHSALRADHPRKNSHGVHESMFRAS